ncbi:hypothetical protein Bca4012_073451 [Brassica carinata]|uniref:Kinesin motor domain-containing protein n=1 Tax=Brassica carinata TaxID=52824 RepID=A0A8X7QMM2_BRACI|nr:hypothetical protein Bca52824_065765 [Brassica carinata]
MKVKEGVYINKGLLALGNVISAFEDERKRKHGAHVPYRDSKPLTFLVNAGFVSLMLAMWVSACISTADINAEETLNTLKYAIRAQNIRNKPVVNRDHVSSEMLKMRQQLEYLQAELPLRDGGSSCSNSRYVVDLSEMIAYLETANELHQCRSRYAGVKHSEKKIKDIQYDEIIGLVKPDGLKRSLHSMESSNYAMVEATIGDSREIDEEAKEWEHKLLQSSMDKELHELNRRLEEKESEMKLFDGYDPAALKQHFGKKVAEVEDEKRFFQVEYVLHLMLKEERNRLLAGIENLASDGEAQKLQDVHAQNLKSLEAQLQDLKKNQENHCQLLKQKQKSDDAARRLEEEFYPSRHIRYKHDVQLQHRMKQEAEQFRQWKVSREKELVQIKRFSCDIKENFHSWVLQRKIEEAAMGTKRLKELLEARKSSPREHTHFISLWFITNIIQFILFYTNEKALPRWLDHELEVMVNVHEVQDTKPCVFNHHQECSLCVVSLAEEFSVLRQVDELAVKGLSPLRGKNGFVRYFFSHELFHSVSNFAFDIILQVLSQEQLGISSNSLVAMASQLSEAEEQERALTNCGCWNQLRSVGEAKNLLQYMFNTLAEASCKSLFVTDRTFVTSLSNCFRTSKTRFCLIRSIADGTLNPSARYLSSLLFSAFLLYYVGFLSVALNSSPMLEYSWSNQKFFHFNSS